MLYKDDWDRAKGRIEAWYRCEAIDRCCLGVTAPRAGVRRREIPAPATVQERWNNLDYVLDRVEEDFRCTWYGGEAVPWFMPNLGPSVFAAWLGAPLRFGEGTTWVQSCISDWGDPDALRRDPENPPWRWIQQATSAAAERGRGKFLVAVTDLHGGGDALAALRGVEDLCVDLALNGDVIREAEAFVRTMWFDVYRDLHARSISTDTGWKISLDRGLDIFQRFETGLLNIQSASQEARRCKAFEITYIRKEDA